MLRSLSRRAVLRGAGVAVGLPLLDVMRSKAAQAAVPKRYVQLAAPLGFSTDQWYSGGPDITFKPFAAALAPHTRDILVVRGMTKYVAVGADGHHDGTGYIYTGQDKAAGYGPSVDQQIAKLAGGGRFPTLHFGFFTLTSTGNPGETHTIFKAANQPINSNNDPKSMYKTLFGDGVPAPSAGGGSVTVADDGNQVLDRALARRRSVLDLVRDDFKELEFGLSRDDKTRLSDHAEYLRSIEMGLMQIDSEPATTPDAPGATATCQAPNGTQINGIQLSDAQGAAIAKAQADLLVMSLACDLTRVATLQYSHCVSSVRYRWLESRRSGISGKDHHAWTHWPSTGNWTTGMPYFHAIESWHIEQFGYIIEQLKRVGAFENTVIAYATNEATGPHGDSEERSMMIAQAPGGYFRTGGRAVSLSNAKPNVVLVHLAKAFGYAGSSYGKAAWGTAAAGLTT